MWRHFIVICLISLVTACGAIPLGSDMTLDDIEKVKVGTTTKQDIEKVLGKPNVMDSPTFSAYRLSENKVGWMFLSSDGVVVGETYDVVFSFDANKVVKELKHDTIVTKGGERYLSLSEHFPEYSYKAVEVSGVPSDVKVSNNGKWVTGLTWDKRFFHEIGGSTKVISPPLVGAGNMTFSESNDSFAACVHKQPPSEDQFFGKVLDLYPFLDSSSSSIISGKISNDRDVAITPLYKDCNERASTSPFQHKIPTHIAISNDGGFLSVVDGKTLSLWSMTDKNEINKINHGKNIGAINFGHNDMLLTSFGGSIVNIWAVPSLRFVKNIKRERQIFAASYSNDGKYFSLASNAHAEIWERTDVSNNNPPHNEWWAFRLKKVIPKPVVYWGGGKSKSRGLGIDSEGVLYSNAGSLTFSSDGRYLMVVDKLVHIWDVKSGKLLALIGDGFTNTNLLHDAAFHGDNYIVIAQSITTNHWLGKNSIVVWKLPLRSVFEKYNGR